ncbi:protein FAR1-RELATED SEQUENCE 2-like isoform X2 [Rosa rugosa]|uniref:protein FAR1-RELATED SEQUENCE 2-like isoform X2 n=1 Tax=Rosa rugosa TaxID=74645 RepID=UPI002B409F01|nr:protein FAR1-RELATED SEQUENCE 2-like isoform X2 [Rosa rugosa]
MEIDLELPTCEQGKLETRLDKDVNIVEINVEKKSEHVKEAHGLRANESVSGVEDQDDANNVEVRVVDKGVVNTVDAADEMNVEKSSEHVGEACGSSANKSASDFQGQDDVNNFVANVVDKGFVVREPENGLEFETKEDAYSYYREYARSVGFGVTIIASRRSKKTGKFIDIKLACSRYRKQEAGDTENRRIQLLNTGCKAGLQMKKRENEKWYIHSFVKEHNHEMGDGFINALGGRNKRPATVACQKKGLQFTLDKEDVQVMFEQLMCMQDENPNFFYAIEFDNDKQLRSVFWVDANGRRDYNSFCDVVLFDTYYVRNNYKIPLVPIVGVNHHFQYILLGCALIGDETTADFVWLMRTWLKAVGGQAPRVVITDQEKYLKEAVADVFTDACHRFCLWHVLTRIHDNVGSINEDAIFQAKLNKWIYRSWTVQQFEQRWWKLINRFELRENERLCLFSLYEDRKYWAPTYMQDSCSAGMSTVERSGSVTSFFDRYISQEAMVKDFMEQYKTFLKDRYDMEANAAFEAQNKRPELRSLSPFEKQMSTIYTDTIFRKFQGEVLGVDSCHLQKEGQDEATVIFRVDDLEERQNFIVAWNEPELRVCCLCHSFEYKGFLCRHALLVLHMSGVSRIPSHYILKRWMKDARVRHTVSDVSKRLNYRVQRFNDLCKLAVKLGEEGSLSPETYQIAFQALDEVLKQCVNVNNSVRGLSEPNASCIHGSNDLEEGNHSGGMAKLSKKKKTHRKRKGQTEPDGIPIRLQDSYQQMELMNSGARNLDSCHVPQQELQGELGSKGRAQDSCYGAQQSMQEMGRLDSVSPICDGYYGNQQVSRGYLHSLPTRVGHHGTQQSMQGMFQGQLGFRAPAVHSSFDIRDTLKDLSAGSSRCHGSTSKHPLNKHLPQ